MAVAAARETQSSPPLFQIAGDVQSFPFFPLSHAFPFSLFVVLIDARKNGVPAQFLMQHLHSCSPTKKKKSSFMLSHQKKIFIHAYLSNGQWLVGYAFIIPVTPPSTNTKTSPNSFYI